MLPALAEDVFNGHKVILDDQNKIIPWSVPPENAYDHFLRLRWNFIKTQVPNCPGPSPRSRIRSITSIARSETRMELWNRIPG